MLDKLIHFFSPEWGLRREIARQQTEQIKRWSLEAGEQNRLNSSIPASRSDVADMAKVRTCANRAWENYRNNPFANRVVRTIVSRIIGAGLQPESQALDAAGNPDMAFRHASKQLYDRFSTEFYEWGKAGRGGMTLTDFYALALTEVIIEGETLVYHRTLSRDEQRARDTFLPLSCQIIRADRLTDFGAKASEGNIIQDGIEFDSAGQRVGYWIDNSTDRLGKAEFIPASNIIHLYRPENADSIRGVSWLAPVLNTLRNLKDFQDNELLASTIANSFALFISRKNNSPISTLNGRNNQSTTDANGNPLSFVEPAQIYYLAPDEQVQEVSPDHPNINTDAFVNQMLRSIAIGAPCTLPSAITGDYRNSSFSSETAAENQNFYEIQLIQNWFCTSLCDQLWREMVNAALLSNLLPDTGDAYSMREVNWRCPVSRFINPSAAENASAMAIENGTSSIIIETGKKGEDWRRILKDNAVVLETAREMGLPDAYIYNLIGMRVKTAPMQVDDKPAPTVAE